MLTPNRNRPYGNQPSRNQLARRLFTPIAPSYERWAAILGLGQDARWRRHMVDRLMVTPNSSVLDVAAGTGSISRLLEARGAKVTALDLTPSMLARHRGATKVVGRAEELPFPDATFDALTFGYLLRYVEDPIACLTELKRVLKTGALIGMVEFGQPQGVWKHLWRLYSGGLLPAAGRLIGHGWHEVGRFLRSSIETFHLAYPDPAAQWKEAGFVDVRFQNLSLGGGLVIWARKP